jgi:catechol 2,3-dioxygenase
MIGGVFTMDFRLPANTHIGYVHLRVASLARSLAFYCETTGFREISWEGSTVALSATGRPPARFLLTEFPGARPRPPHTAGLYHVAIRLPSRQALAQLIKHIISLHWPLRGAADHGATESFYLADPDGNGLEFYVDCPDQQWPREDDGLLALFTEPLDLKSLLEQATSPWKGLDPAADIGHVHLHVADLARAEVFYSQQLGLNVTQRAIPGVLLMAAGRYHHHLGVNTWAGRGAPPAPADSAGLAAYALCIPDDGTWQEVIEWMQRKGVPVEMDGTESALVRDPDGTQVRLIKAM